MPKTRRRWPLVAILPILWAVAAPPSGADPPPELILEGNTVVISGFEPGAEVVTFDFYRYSDGFGPHNEHRAAIAVDEGGDGELHMELARDLPRKYLAPAVELATGRFGVFEPEGSPGPEIALPAHSLLPRPGQPSFPPRGRYQE